MGRRHCSRVPRTWNTVRSNQPRASPEWRANGQLVHGMFHGAAEHRFRRIRRRLSGRLGRGLINAWVRSRRGREQERGSEAKCGGQACEVATVLERLGDHRVREHGEDRAGGEGLDQGHGSLVHPAEQPEAEP